MCKKEIKAKPKRYCKNKTSCTSGENLPCKTLKFPLSLLVKFCP